MKQGNYGTFTGRPQSVPWLPDAYYMQKKQELAEITSFMLIGWP